MLAAMATIHIQSLELKWCGKKSINKHRGERKRSTGLLCECCSSKYWKNFTLILLVKRGWHKKHVLQQNYVGSQGNYSYTIIRAEVQCVLISSAAYMRWVNKTIAVLNINHKSHFKEVSSSSFMFNCLKWPFFDPNTDDKIWPLLSLFICL